MRRRPAPLLACLFLAWITVVSAQTTTSSLRGTVRDLGGRPVAGASVHARSVSRGEARSTVTDRQGRYGFDLLKPGLWIVAANLPDGSTSESRTVTLRLQAALTVDLTLGKGLSEQVTVRAEAPVVDSQRVGAEVRIGSAQADELPFAGRVVTDVPLVNAAVKSVPTTDFVGERGAVFVVNGQSGRSNSFLVDGMDNNDRVSGTSMNSSFSQLAVRELVLNTGRYAAEFGRASGAIFNIVTEQGGNLETGEILFQVAPVGMNAAGDFVSSLPAPYGSRGVGSRTETGFKVGGPMVEDKAFYFAAYERQREDRILPYSGVDRSGAAGGWTVAPQKDDNLFLRTDFNLSPSELLMVRLSGDARVTSGLNVSGFSTPETGFHLDEHDVQLASSLTSVISPKVFNEARLLVGTSAFHQFADSDRPGIDRPAGSFGGNQLNVQLREEDKLELLDNLTWRVGRHMMKYGFDVTRTRTNIRTRFNENGNFLYNTDAPYNVGTCSDGPFGGQFWKVMQAINDGTYPLIPCSDAPADDPLRGAADIGTFPLYWVYVVGEPRATLWDTQVGAFAQDTWQIGSRFLVDYGLRYDVSTFRLPPSARVDSPIPNGGARPDRDNVAPRLGFTYTGGSDRQWVVRGGGGLFYDKLVMAFPAVAAVMSGTKILLIPIQGTTLPITEATIEDPVQGPMVKEVVLDPVNGFAPEDLIMRFSTGTHLETPHTVQWSLGVERRLGSRASLQVEATRALGYGLPLMKDLNPVIAYQDPWTGVEVTQPDPLYLNYYTPVHRDGTTGSIAAIVTEGRSWYNGLDVAWRWQGEGGWYSASYTLSRSEDMGPDPLKGGIYLPPDSDHLSGERARSDADRRHRFVLSGDRPLPWMGLHASGVIQLSSGAPFNVTTGQDDDLNGITTDRPAGVGRNTGEKTRLGTINALREQENVLRRLRGQPDLAPVRALHEPKFFQVDLRVSKPFAMREGRSKGQLFLQVFNLLDRVNGGLVDGRVLSPDFGKVIGLAGPPRTLELGLRVGY
jgi:hypothetical protein